MPEPINKETRRIKGLFESGEKNPEVPAAAPKSETFEYRDAEGKVHAKVELTYGEDVVFKKGTKGRRLEKLVIVGEKDGQPTALDVLSMVNTRDVGVVVSESGESKDAFYVEDEFAALVPKLDSPTGLAVLLHELGHAEQFGEAKFQSMAAYYGHGKREKQSGIPSMTRAELESIVQDVTANFPELPQNLAAYELRELAHLEPKLREASIRENDAERELTRVKLDQRRIESGQLQEIFKSKIDLIEAFMEFKDAESEPAVLINKLRELGIEIGPESKGREPDPVEAMMETSGSLVLGEEDESVETDRPAKKVGLNESDISSADDAAAIAFGIRSKLSGTGAKEVDWNEESGLVTVKFVSMLGRGDNRRREVTVRFAVDRETQVLMRKERDALLPAIESRLRLEEAAVAELQSLESQWKEIMNSSLIREVVRTPKRLMERNATARAFNWANKIKDATGADLFQPHHVDARLDMRKHLPDKGGDEDCGSTVMSAIDSGKPPMEITDIKEQLTAALHSHGDERPTIQKLRKAGQL